jgi:hypothetical protein
MRWHLLILPAAALLAGALTVNSGARDIVSTPYQPLARRLEVARLQAHFDSVDTELRQATMLGGQRTGSRITLMGWLREYREAARFPQNDRFPQRAMPFFRDRHGTLCAMAYLIERSGRGDIVDRVALTRNNAFIAELAGDRELRSWLDSVGLTVAEAARIQPSYGFGPDPDDQKVGSDYALGSIFVSGTSLATLGLNLFAPSRSSGWAGVIAGSTGVIAGAANLDGNPGTRKVAVADLFIGGMAVAGGIYRLIRPVAVRPSDELSQQSGRDEACLAVVPQVIPTSDGTRLGLAMHATF